MRGPKPPTVTLSPAERAALAQVVRRHTTPQHVALRARIVRAAGAGHPNAHIARDGAVTLDTVRRWRGRWLARQAITLADLPVADRLADAPRSGKPVRITDAQVCHIIELACAAPARSGRPISQWTGREVAAEIMARGIVDRISGRHATRLLKRGISSPTAGASG
jgi:putative transposase